MIQFEKYHGTGNDFIFVRDVNEDLSVLAKRLCHRHFGIGADGLMIASPSDVADIKMTYYNSDGSHATMCGNGLRCFSQYVKDNQCVNKNHFLVETDAGILPVTIEEDGVRIRLNRERRNLFNSESLIPMLDLKPIKINEIEMIGLFLGTLHAVVLVQDFDDIELLGPQLTKDINFPNEINVNFVRVIDKNHIEVRTHERGAGWTLSCGTGVSASGVVTYALGLSESKVHVKTLGGELVVQCLEDGIELKGPAEWIARGETR